MANYYPRLDWTLGTSVPTFALLWRHSVVTSTEWFARVNGGSWVSLGTVGDGAQYLTHTFTVTNGGAATSIGIKQVSDGTTTDQHDFTFPANKLFGSTSVTVNLPVVVWMDEAEAWWADSYVGTNSVDFSPSKTTSVDATLTDAPVTPGAPTIGTPTQDIDARVTLPVTASGTGTTTGLKVFRGGVDVSTSCSITNTSGLSWTVVDGHPPLGSSLAYKVQATNGGATSTDSNTVNITPSVVTADVLALRAHYMKVNAATIIGQESYDFGRLLEDYARALYDCDETTYSGDTAGLQGTIDTLLGKCANTTPEDGLWLDANGIARIGADDGDPLTRLANSRLAVGCYVAADLLDQLGETTRAATARGIARDVIEAQWAYLPRVTDTPHGAGSPTLHRWALNYFHGIGTTYTVNVDTPGINPNQDAQDAAALAYAYADSGSVLFESADVLTAISELATLIASCQFTGRLAYAENGTHTDGSGTHDNIDYFWVGYGVWAAKLLAIAEVKLASRGQSIETLGTILSGCKTWFDADYSTEAQLLSAVGEDGGYPDNIAICRSVYLLLGYTHALDGLQFTACYNNTDGSADGYSATGVPTALDELWTAHANTGLAVEQALLTIPSAPLDVVLVNSGDTATATCTDTAFNETGHEVEWAVDGGAWGESATQVVASYTEGVPTFTHSSAGVSSLQARVRAYNANGASVWIASNILAQSHAFYYRTFVC